MKMFKRRLKDNKGFSLVELIVVIAIMVILMALLIPNVVGYVNTARSSANAATASSLFTAANTSITTALSEGVSYATYKTDAFTTTRTWNIKSLVAGAPPSWTKVTVYLNKDTYSIVAVKYEVGDVDYFHPSTYTTATPPTGTNIESISGVS